MRPVRKQAQVKELQNLRVAAHECAIGWLVARYERDLIDLGETLEPLDPLDD